LLLSCCTSGCTRDLKVGDCLQATFDGKPQTVKILEVGEYSYRVMDPDGDEWRTSSKRDQVQTDCYGQFDKFNNKESK
jgi:hypothetical protein